MFGKKQQKIDELKIQLLNTTLKEDNYVFLLRALKVAWEGLNANKDLMTTRIYRGEIDRLLSKVNYTGECIHSNIKLKLE